MEGPGLNQGAMQSQNAVPVRKLRYNGKIT